jgi:NDP-sugar pyrophosphorylase family protein
VAQLGPVTDAAILVGGFGTRLRPVVGDRPKALAPIARRPFLSYLLEQIAAAGIERAVLCTGHLGQQLEATFGDRFGGLRLTYSREPEPRGTAGAVRLAEPLLQGEPVLVLNGDSYCDAPLGDFVAWYGSRPAAPSGSLLLNWADDTARYGAVDVDAAGDIVAFCEKGGSSAPGWISAGIYLLARRLVMSIPADAPVSLERDVFPAWVGRGLAGHRTRAPFLDIGTPESYAQAETFFSARGRSVRAHG